MGLLDFLKKKELAEIKRLDDLIKEKDKQIEALRQYEGIVDADNLIGQKLKNCEEEIQAKRTQFDQEKSSLEHEISELQKKIDELTQKYKQGFETYENLKKETEIYRETLDLAEYGFYEPYFKFDTSEEYKQNILFIRDRQKSMIKSGTAVCGGENIMWNNSLSQGQAMVKKEKKLILRAFNGECDSLIADVEWNNITKMQDRIEKSYLAINKLYEKQGIYISHSYKQLKLDELHCAFEYKDKKHDEKEEQRAIREQMREEEKARREIEAAMIKAQKEEEMYQKALNKARKEIISLEGEKQIKLQQKITELEARIAEAEAIINKYRGKNFLLNINERYSNYKNYLHRMNRNLKEFGYTRVGKRGKKDKEGAFPFLSTYYTRHTWATLAAYLEIPKETIAAALGHGKKDVTDIYISFDQNKIDEANRRVIDYLNKN